MVRAAAKNHASVAIVTDPAEYPSVLMAVRGGGFSLEQRRTLAAQAFVHTATYDVAVASWMGNVLTDSSDGTGFPAWTGATWDKKTVLRYGENPHQRAALYTHWRAGLANAEQLHGKEMSYNNYVDADAAQRAASDHAEPAVAIIKHANPCGIAVGDGHRAGAPAGARLRPGVRLRRRRRDEPAGDGRAGRPGRRDLHRGGRGPRLRAGGAGDPDPQEEHPADAAAGRMERTADQVEFRAISGGVLMQTRDKIDAEAGGGDDPSRWTLVAGEAADDATLADLRFAWRAIRAVKSNAILLADEGASVGVGMGQVNRVDSCRLAVSRAGEERARGAVAASDAFFPFADGLQVLLDAGVRAVVAPGGSVRDAEVVEAATAAGVTMYFTGTRHFAH